MDKNLALAIDQIHFLLAVDEEYDFNTLSAYEILNYMKEASTKAYDFLKPLVETLQNDNSDYMHNIILLLAYIESIKALTFNEVANVSSADSCRLKEAHTLCNKITNLLDKLQ